MRQTLFSMMYTQKHQTKNSLSTRDTERDVAIALLSSSLRAKQSRRGRERERERELFRQVLNGLHTLLAAISVDALCNTACNCGMFTGFDKA